MVEEVGVTWDRSTGRTGYEEDPGFVMNRFERYRGKDSLRIEASLNDGNLQRRRRVLFIQYANPAAYPPLEHAAHILASAGWRVRVLDPGSLETAAIKFPLAPGIEIMKGRYCPPGWRQKIHYVQYGFSALMQAIRWRPAWIYGSDFMVAPILLAVSVLARCPVLYHEHDTPGSHAPSFISRICIVARRILATRAGAVVIPNAVRAAAVSKDLGIAHPVVVWNCPRLEEVSVSRDQRHPGLRLLYHGSINASRVPTNLVTALSRTAPSVTMTIVGYETIGSRGHLDLLRETAVRSGVAERLTVHEPMNRADLRKLRNQFDVGIAVVGLDAEDENLRMLIGASCKVFEYMASGMALLVNGCAEWHTAFVEPGYGLGCDPANPGSIAAAITWLHENPDERRRMGERGRARIETEWHYEAQFRPVLALLEASILGRETDPRGVINA